MRLLIALFISFSFSFSFSAFAGNGNHFAYSYGTGIIGEDEREFSQWVTFREGKQAGRYRVWNLSAEYEFALGESSQLSTYLHFAHHDIRGVPGLSDVSSAWNWTGFQVAYKYGLRPAKDDQWGVAVYLEPGFFRVSRHSGQFENEVSLEGKLLLQRTARGGDLIYVVNISPEVEFEQEEELSGEKEWESELVFKTTAGVSYRVLADWRAGVEARYGTAFPKFGAKEYEAFWVGPNLQHNGDDWYASITFLPQVSGSPVTRGGLNLEELERQEWRLRAGVEF